VPPFAGLRCYASTPTRVLTCPEEAGGCGCNIELNRMGEGGWTIATFSHEGSTSSSAPSTR